MERQVGIVKDNAVTRMADQIKAMNAESGRAAGRFTGSPVQVLTGPRVSSAAMLAPPIPLDPEVQADLDNKAKEIGIMPTEGSDDSYQSFEEAARAGESINPPARSLQNEREDETVASRMSLPRMTAREFLDEKYPDLIKQKLAAPRLLDFSKIQGIDLIRGIAYVDNFDLPIPAAKVKELKQYVLQLTKKFVKEQLDKAMDAIDPLPKEIVEQIESIEHKAPEDSAGNSQPPNSDGRY